jgi:uncharacterized Tic20 family protein
MSEASSQDSRNIAVLVWLGTIFFWFLPSFIAYLIKTDDPYVRDQAKEALNWSITVIIGACVGAILVFVLIGFLVLFAVAICNLVFCILGAVAASNGRAYQVPFAIRLLK